MSLWAVLTSNNLGLLNPYLGPATRGGVDMGWATFSHPTLSLGQAATQYIRSAGVPTTIEASGATADITDLPPLTSAGLVNDHCGQLIFVPDFKWPALGADITQDIKTLFYGIGGSTSNRLHIYGRVSTGTIVVEWVGNNAPSIIESDPIEFGWGDVVDIRWRITVGVGILWVNGVEFYFSQIFGNPSTGIRTLSLGDNTTNPEVRIIGLRLVQEALSSSQIEEWPEWDEPIPIHVDGPDDLFLDAS